MSKTPRTDSYVAMLIAEGADADSLEHFARDLERELAAANERIRRLEEAADDLENSVACGCGIDGPCARCREALDGWRQAKEAKP